MVEPLSAGGTNALNVTGTGGSGLGGNNHGVFGRSTVGGPANLTSGGGNVTVTGLPGRVEPTTSDWFCKAAPGSRRRRMEATSP